MRVYISADIEGVTGLVSWSQCGRPNSQHYDFPFARRMMTHDVNAAIRGVHAGGATFVRVKDSHGNSKNLLIDELEPGIELVTGHGSGIDGMMEGLDDSFDAALLVGYHAKAGTLGGIMEHTITGGVHRMWINGEEHGEMGLSAGVAGRLGVPIVFVSSDEAGIRESSAFLPWAKTAAVKEGYGRYMGKTLHPSETGKLIEYGAKEAIEGLKAMKPWKVKEPSTIKVEFNRAEETDWVARAPGVERIDGYAVSFSGPSYEEAHRAFWMAIGLSQCGSRSGD